MPKIVVQLPDELAEVTDEMIKEGIELAANGQLHAAKESAARRPPPSRSHNPRAGEAEYLVEEAIKAGKFARSREEHYYSMYDRDPEACREVIARLEAVPEALRRADAGPTSPAYPPEWIPELHRPSGAVTFGLD